VLQAASAAAGETILRAETDEFSARAIDKTTASAGAAAARRRHCV